MQKLKVAVVGVGYLGNFHAQKYRALQDQAELGIELVGVCDLNETQSRKIAGELSVQAFTRPEDLLGKVDAVAIATVTPTHYELTRFFLGHGVHVNVEKPISLTSSEAQNLVDLAKEKSLVLCVGHSERFNPAFLELKSRLRDPKYIEFNRYAPFKSRGADVSILHDLMIHDLDLMLSLDPTECRLVTAQAGKVVTETYDWCMAHFEFKSGLKVQVNSSRLAKEMTRSIRAFGASVWAANLQTGDVEQSDLSPERENPLNYQVKSVGKGDNLLAETNAFVSAIQGRQSMPVRGEDGVRALLKVEEILDFLDGSPEAS